MTQHKYHGHLSNARSVGVEIGDYMSSRYGSPKPEIKTTLYVDLEELTLAHLHELVNMTDNYPENAPVTFYDGFIQVVREATKPVEMHHRGGGHIQWKTGLEEIKKTPPRDELGRFTKRK